MSQRQMSPEEQAQAIIQEFQTNVAVATKPINDLIKGFGAYIQITNTMLRQKDEEILKLKGQVVKEANKDVALPSASTKK